jgi:hypothetical protein
MNNAADIPYYAIYSNRRKAKFLLKLLSLRLEEKWLSSSSSADADHEDGWGCGNAARRFNEETGCPLDSARRYFYRIEDTAEWRAILGREPTIMDTITLTGSFSIRLPKQLLNIAILFQDGDFICFGMMPESTSCLAAPLAISVNRYVVAVAQPH